MQVKGPAEANALRYTLTQREITELTCSLTRISLTAQPLYCNISGLDTEFIGVGVGNITLSYRCVIQHGDLPNVALYLLRGVWLSFCRNWVVYRPDCDGVWHIWTKSRLYFCSAGLDRELTC
jgi:hypothetical protein